MFVRVIGSTQKQPVGHLHDVGFVEHGDLSTLPHRRVAERPLGDPATAFFGRHLHAHHDAWSDFVFHAAVQTLGVFANDDQIDVVEAGVDARQAAHRSNSGVKRELFAHLHVDGRKAFANGSGAGTFQRHFVVADRIDSFFRQHLFTVLERAEPGFAALPVKACAGGVQDPHDGVSNFRADPVSRDQYGFTHGYCLSDCDLLRI